MSRALAFPGDKAFELLQVAHTSDSDLFASKNLSKLPTGWAVRMLVLLGELDVDIDTAGNGGASMTTADQAVQAIKTLSIEGAEDLVGIHDVSGDTLATLCRLIPPMGMNNFDFVPGTSTAPQANATTSINVCVPILYPNTFAPGGEQDRYPSEFLRQLQLSMSTNTDATWVTVGTGGSVSGTWRVVAICTPASKVILPCPLQIESVSVNAGVEYPIKHKTFYYETIGRESIGSAVASTDQDSINFSGVEHYPANFRQRAIQALELMKKETLNAVSDTRYPDTEIDRLLGGRSEYGDEILGQVAPTTDVTYTPQNNATLVMRKRRRWTRDLLAQYAEIMEMDITGATLLGPSKGQRFKFKEGSVLPADTGITT